MHRRLQVILVFAALALIASTPSASGGSSNAAPGQQPPTNTSLPTIGGTPAQGSTLSASTGAWSGVSITYTYQWYGCGSGGANCAPEPTWKTSSHLLRAAHSRHKTP